MLCALIMAGGKGTRFWPLSTEEKPKQFLNLIGENTMIDMNAVIGARGKIGKRVHLGAGAIIAGVLEPPSQEPCIIDHFFENYSSLIPKSIILIGGYNPNSTFNITSFTQTVYNTVVAIDAIIISKL